MGAISFSYNVKPKVIDALKEDMSLPIVDFNIDKLKTYPGYDDWQYCVYAACKYKDQVVCIVGLIKYDDLNKECYVKVMDETCGPGMTNISKQVFNKLTPLKEKSFAQEWRDKVKKKLNLKEAA